MARVLLEEEIVALSKLPASARKLLEGGIVRIVDAKGKTFGLFLSPEIIEELLEDIEESSPEFWKRQKKSLHSGHVSSSTVRRRIGLSS